MAPRDVRLGFVERDVRHAAGAISFERGEDYAGAVSGLDIGDGTIRATVPGRETYHVELVVTRGAGVTGSCDCQYGAEGHFCKHCAAVGLAALRQAAPPPPEPAADAVPAERPAAERRPADPDRVAPWLESLDRRALLALLREEADADPDLRSRLLLRAEVAGADRAAVRDRVKAVLDPGAFARGGYADPDQASQYAEQAAEAVAILRALGAAGRLAESVDGARWAMWRLGEVLERSESEAALELISLLSDLAKLHLRACRAARPDPEGTARWLVGHVLGPAGKVTRVDPVDYRDVLGPAGTARALDLATEAWRRAPAGGAARLRERLLKARGDVDGLVAAYAADPDPDGASHLRIARELDGAGRAAEALEWAERGLRAVGARPGVDQDLVEWVCARYERTGRTDDALAVRRDRFRAGASLRSYRSLRSAARLCGRWEAERDAALGQLRASADSRGSVPGARIPRSVFVEVLLDEGLADEAWEAAAHGAGDDLLLTLADRIRDHRPADALGAYLRMLEPLKESRSERDYQAITRLLRSIRACHERLGTPEEFSIRLAALRGELKRKRKLLTILDANGL